MRPAKNDQVCDNGLVVSLAVLQAKQYQTHREKCMFKKIVLPFAAALLLSVGNGTAIAEVTWSDTRGGPFNIPSEEFNPTYYGWGSFGFGTSRGIRYNKVDLHKGGSDKAEKTMYISSDDDVLLYDNSGNIITRAWESPIGWDHVSATRDGGIAAGGITEIKISGVSHTMVYAWSVNSRIGRQSGWIKLEDLSPTIDISDILTSNKIERDAILRSNGAYGSGTYQEHTVVEAYLPTAKYDYYVTANRSSSNGAGRARYYYTNIDNQYISGLMNIPETGSQRYGVAHDIIALGSTFYVASYANSHNVTLFPSGSGSSDGSMTLVFGYALTSAGRKIYSWINKAALSSTGRTIGSSPSPSKVVHITKRNSTGYALDGGFGASNLQNIYLWRGNRNTANQQWIEIDRGNNYYSYQKMGTNHCIDGGGPSAVNRGNVYLFSCASGNRNQHWKKVSKGGGAYQLRKRSNENYAIDGGNNGTNRQNVGIWGSVAASHNLQWFITTVGTN